MVPFFVGPVCNKKPKGNHLFGGRGSKPLKRPHPTASTQPPSGPVRAGSRLVPAKVGVGDGRALQAPQTGPAQPEEGGPVGDDFGVQHPHRELGAVQPPVPPPATRAETRRRDEPSTAQEPKQSAESFSKDCASQFSRTLFEGSLKRDRRKQGASCHRSSSPSARSSGQLLSASRPSMGLPCRTKRTRGGFRQSASLYLVLWSQLV